MTDIKQHEYDLLKEIGHDPMATQANLSTRLGIAVGSVNCYIKRFTQRAMTSARDSLKVYGVYRKKAKTVVEQLQQKVIKQVHIEGDDEAVDLLRLACIEAGIRLSEISNGVTMKVVGQDYQMSIEDLTNADCV